MAGSAMGHGVFGVDNSNYEQQMQQVLGRNAQSGQGRGQVAGGLHFSQGQQHPAGSTGGGNQWQQRGRLAEVLRETESGRQD